jgi:hypothetical protein
VIRHCAFCDRSDDLNYVIKHTSIPVCAKCAAGRIQHLNRVKATVTAIAEGKDDAKE